jgi:hypothetical protein
VWPARWPLVQARVSWCDPSGGRTSSSSWKMRCLSTSARLPSPSTLSFTCTPQRGPGSQSKAGRSLGVADMTDGDSRVSSPSGGQRDASAAPPSPCSCASTAPWPTQTHTTHTQLISAARRLYTGNEGGWGALFAMYICDATAGRMAYLRGLSLGCLELVYLLLHTLLQDLQGKHAPRT